MGRRTVPLPRPPAAVAATGPACPAYRGDVALAVCLLFDARTDRAVRALWDRLEARGVPTLRTHTHGHHVPHLSYAVLRRWDLDAVRGVLDGLPHGGPVELSFDALGTFRRGRSWLAPALPAEVFGRQERVACALAAAGMDLHLHYVPGSWVPHCTLAPRVRTADLPELAAAVYEVLPLPARADRAALIDSSTGERWGLPYLP